MIFQAMKNVITSITHTQEDQLKPEIYHMLAKLIFKNKMLSQSSSKVFL